MRIDLYKDLYNLEGQHWWHLAKREKVLYFIKKYSRIKTPKILDIGCGTGKNVEVYNILGVGYGIDKSSEAIKFCRRRGLKRIKVCKSEKIKNRSSYFDVVTLLDVLEHVEESPTLKEIKRVLKTNGILIISVPAFTWLWSQWDKVLKHKRRYSINTLKAILKQEGFKTVTISYAYSFLVLPVLIIRIIKSRVYKNYYPSDFKLSNKVVNRLLFLTSKAESFLMYNGKIPFGTSIFCVATKK